MKSAESESIVEYEGKFFLGRTYNLQKGKLEDDPILYDPDDLTTHGVVVGMTGSGKTGLCVDLLEEAGLNGIPAILIDPKGDVANLLLHFPSLRSEDFEPWIDQDQARREKKTPQQAAEEVAELWREGLARWGITSERIQKVTDSVEYAVYTPGSDAGIPVNILSSLKAPGGEWKADKDLMREEISSTVTALLGLVGVEADPVQSREHILLSNIFENAWKDGKDLSLEDLIRQIQNPPMEKLGAFELEQFYPTEERFELAMNLNNLLASPTFQGWIEGMPLDIPNLLWSESGKPRHSVFYLAHLPDSERMFFVTLLLTAIEAWMRTQTGSSSLKALLYIDEVLGYLPPVLNPPSKPPLLRLLKQARAFGVGVLLTTQNPVDLDYKGLSNAGTWFVGRLQTEQDKSRLLDGLESAAGGKGGFQRSQASDTIAALQKRVFLLHNVHEKAPQIFHTRWAMAYLPGPIARAQIGSLNQLVKADVPELTRVTPRETSPISPDRPTTAGEEISEGTYETRPKGPKGVHEYFIGNTLTVSEAMKSAGLSGKKIERLGSNYLPALLAQADVRFLDRKYGIDTVRKISYLLHHPDENGFIRWGEVDQRDKAVASIDTSPMEDTRYADLGAPLIDPKLMKSIKTDFIDYIYSSVSLDLPYNPELDILAKPGMTKDEFQHACEDAASEQQAAEVKKLQSKYKVKIKRMQDKLAREERELAEDQAEHAARKLEEAATAAENILGLFSGSRSRRRVSTSMTKRRMTSKAKSDVEESVEAIEDYKEELLELEEDLQDELDEIEDRWADVATDIEQRVITPYKKNIRIDLFGIGWVPYWRLSIDGEEHEVAAYS